jgi:hypothetical protein
MAPMLREVYRTPIGLVVRDAAYAAPHHEGFRPHPRVSVSSSLEEAQSAVSKDEATELR